jgi:bacterioferritin (cytochrome b1)
LSTSIEKSCGSKSSFDSVDPSRLLTKLGIDKACPRPVPKATTNHEMLEAVLADEIKAGKDYTQRAAEAEAFGDKGLVVALEDMVRDETGHSEETERILRDWPL